MLHPTFPMLVTFELRRELENSRRNAEYALAHGRDGWSPEFVAHVETGLEQLREIEAVVEGIWTRDSQAVAAESERIEQADRTAGRGRKPWATY